MKLFLLLLLLAAFLQSAFLPINLCLILLICRSFALEDESNYYLAIFAGIILGFLTSVNLGFWALIFLLIVKITHLIRKLPFSANYLTILPVSFVLILASTNIDSLISKSTLNFSGVLISSLLVLPFYIATKIWEDRYIVKSGVKLKI